MCFFPPLSAIHLFLWIIWVRFFSELIEISHKEQMEILMEEEV